MVHQWIQQWRKWEDIDTVQVAEKESFVTIMPSYDSVCWLTVWSSLRDICLPSVTELEGLLPPNKATYEECFDKSSIVNNHGSFNPKQYEKYVLNVHHQSSTTPEDGNWVLLGSWMWNVVMSLLGDSLSQTLGIFGELLANNSLRHHEERIEANTCTHE